MISKPALARALLTVEKDKRENLPFVCSTTPGWLWADSWGVRSDKMKPVRTCEEEGASAGAFLQAAVALLDNPKNHLVLRNGPRESSDGAVNLYVLARPTGNARDLVGVDARLWPLLEGLELWGAGPRCVVAGFTEGRVEVIVMPRVLSEEDKTSGATDGETSSRAESPRHSRRACSLPAGSGGVRSIEEKKHT